MKYNKEITEFIWRLAGYTNEPSKFHRAYVSDGLIYTAEYCIENQNKISHYRYFSLYRFNDKLKQIVEDKFNLKIPKENDMIVCRCGESKSFSAYYDGYSLNLRCTKCKHEFTAYSG